MNPSPNDHRATEASSSIGQAFGSGQTGRSQDIPSSSIQRIYRTLLNTIMDEDGNSQRTSPVDSRDANIVSVTDPSLVLVPSSEQIRIGEITQSRENEDEQIPPGEPRLRCSHSSSMIELPHEPPDRLTRSILAGPHRSRSKKSVSFDDQHKVYEAPTEIYRSPSTRILDDLAYFARRLAIRSSLDTNRDSLDASKTDGRNTELESPGVNLSTAASLRIPQVTVAGASNTTTTDQNSGSERNVAGVPREASEQNSIAQESHESQAPDRESGAQPSFQTPGVEGELETIHPQAPVTPGNNIRSSSIFHLSGVTLAPDNSPPEHRGSVQLASRTDPSLFHLSGVTLAPDNSPPERSVQLASRTDPSPEDGTAPAPRNNTRMARIWAKIKHLWNVVWRNVLDTLC